MSCIVSSPLIPKHLAKLRIIRHLLIAAIIALLHSVCLPVSGDAFVMEEPGHFCGTGYHKLSASGPLCSLTIKPGNESLPTASNGTIRIGQQNGSLKEVV